MKSVYLIGFRGVGFRDNRYKAENPLVWAGHVGFAFEGDENTIYGFHPTERAVASIGSNEDVIKWLKAQNTLSGKLHYDTHVFVRAYEISKQNSKTQVWKIGIELEDDDFDVAFQQAIQWYNDQKEFAYAFPDIEGKRTVEADNCATFPRRLGLPLPESTGQLFDYIPEMEKQGSAWRP